MSWNYRILDLGDQGFGLYEVYYDEDGEPDSWTTEPISFVSFRDEGPEGIIASLEQALISARTLPVLRVVDGELTVVEADRPKDLEDDPTD